MLLTRREVNYLRPTKVSDIMVDWALVNRFYSDNLGLLLSPFFRRQNSVWDKVVKIFMILLMSVLSPLYIVLQLMAMNKAKNLSQFTFYSSFILNVILTKYKVFRILTQVNSVKRLFLKFNSFRSSEWCEERAERVLLASTQFCKRVNFWFKVAIVLGFVFWYIMPIFFVELLRIFLGDQFSHSDLVQSVPTTFPFHYPSPIKELLYFLDMTVSAALGNLWLAMDTLFLVIVTMTRAQFQILKTALTVPRSDGKTLNLQSFIKDHQMLIEVIAILKRTLSPILAIQLLNSITIVGSVIFDITMIPVFAQSSSFSNNMIHYVKVLSYLVVTLFVLLFYCWISQEANSANREAYYAIVESNWYNLSQAEKKASILILQLGQRSVDFTALGMARINLTTFLDILRVSYSYFTIVKQVLEKE